jgi:hypothetical protein
MSDVKTLFGYLTTRFPYNYDATNKELSHMSGVPLKGSLSSTRAAFSEMLMQRAGSLFFI